MHFNCNIFSINENIYDHNETANIFNNNVTFNVFSESQRQCFKMNAIWFDFDETLISVQDFSALNVTSSFKFVVKNRNVFDELNCVFTNICTKSSHVMFDFSNLETNLASSNCANEFFYFDSLSSFHNVQTSLNSEKSLLKTFTINFKIKIIRLVTASEYHEIEWESIRISSQTLDKQWQLYHFIDNRTLISSNNDEFSSETDFVNQANCYAHSSKTVSRSSLKVSFKKKRKERRLKFNRDDHF